MSTTFDRERGFRGQALKEIVVRIGSTDTLVVQSAAVDLAIMAQFSEYNRTQMVEHGAIEQIVTMLLKPSSHSAETIGHALMGLTVLCQGGYPDVEHVSPAAVRAAIVEAGGVRCLVALLNDCGTRLNSMGTIPRESLDQLRVYAKVAGAIVTLCEESEPNARAFAQAGAIKPLLALLGCTMRVPQRLLSPLEPDISDPNAAGARAAAAVSALACNEELQRRLVDEGAFAPLCGLCTISPNAICREECAKALFKLVIGSIHNKIELCTLGGVECLIGLLISARTPKAHFYSGRALVHLATDHDDGKELVMKRLQEVLICPNTIQFHAPAFQADETLMELQERCAKANNGHGVIVRAHPMRLVSVVATMASIVLEKWRVRLEYELTPLPIEAEQDEDEDVRDPLQHYQAHRRQHSTWSA